MKDLTSDLKKQFNRDLERYTELRREVSKLRKRLDALHTLIELEEEDDSIQVEAQRAKVTFTPTISLGEFILNKMQDGNPWSLVDLRDAAIDAKLLEDSSSPGRSVMGALMGLKRSGQVEKLGDDWVLSKKASQ